MRNFLVYALVLAAACVAGPAAAQESHDAQMDPQAMEELMMKLMTPGEPHALLGGMAGDWKISITSYMEGPDPVTTEGTYTGQAILGGRYVEGRYAGTSMGMPFEGLQIDGYDNAKQEYFTIWLDNFGTGYYIAHGQLDADGKTLRQSGTMTFGPMEIPSRSEMVYGGDTARFTMWHTMGGQEIKAMDMTFTRVK